MAKLPVVVVGVPYHRDLPAPFVQSLVGVLERSHRETLTVRVAYSQTPAIHLSRENLLRHFLAGGADFLVMVDDDQVFAPDVVERLVGWDKPLVAPLIVTRQGDPRPVAYERTGKDFRGLVQYRSLGAECWAYLSQFEPGRLATPSVCLPTVIDHPRSMRDVPRGVDAGLRSPLLEVDAVGGGMTCLSREAAKAIDPGPDDRYFDWEQGGEDLSFCRRVKAAGLAIHVDRGCLVGHLTSYARGAVDLGNWLRAEAQAGPERNDGDAPDLGERLAWDARAPTPGPWRTEPLPEPEPAA